MNSIYKELMEGNSIGLYTYKEYKIPIINISKTYKVKFYTKLPQTLSFIKANSPYNSHPQTERP